METNYQRVYTINIPLNHYQIPLDRYKSHEMIVHRYLTTIFPYKKTHNLWTPPSWYQWIVQVPVVALTSWWTIKKLVLTALHRYLDLSTPAGQLLQIENNISREHCFWVKLCGSCGKTCQNPRSFAISAGKKLKKHIFKCSMACFSWSNPISVAESHHSPH